MKNPEKILEYLIHLFEEQEHIKITYTIRNVSDSPSTSQASKKKNHKASK